MILERNARLFVINSLQLTSFGIYRSRRSSRDREREGRRKIILVARPGTRNLSPSPSIFLSLPRPGEMPSQPVSHDGPTGPEKWSKNFLEIDWTRLLRLSAHGWCTHHRRVVDKLSSYLRSNGHIFFFFSAPVKYSSPKDSKRIIPFFLFTDNFVRKHRKEISKFEDWYYYFHFEEKLNFTKGCSILYQYYASVKGEPQKKDHRCI